jgi:hypothetical protein
MKHVQIGGRLGHHGSDKIAAAKPSVNVSFIA